MICGNAIMKVRHGAGGSGRLAHFSKMQGFLSRVAEALHRPYLLSALSSYPMFGICNCHLALSSWPAMRLTKSRSNLSQPRKNLPPLTLRYRTLCTPHVSRCLQAKLAQG